MPLSNQLVVRIEFDDVVFTQPLHTTNYQLALTRAKQFMEEAEVVQADVRRITIECPPENTTSKS